MSESHFFESLEHHLNQQLPFACFAKHQNLKAYLQNNNTIHDVVEFKEPGFVFCPFSSSHQQVIFPESQSKVLTSNLQAKNIESQSASFSDSLIDKQKHIELVSKAIQTIKNTDIQKIVCSRKITVEKSINPLKIFKALASKYRDAFSYCWYHPQIGLWLGATPEQFLHFERNTMQTVALAGTLNALVYPKPIWTAKEIDEQQMVVDYIVSGLKKYTENININDRESIRAGNLWHLKTSISADIKPEQLKSVILALHPTSAVCGLPKDKAKTFILNHEIYDRAYYAGFLGEMHYKQAINRSKTRRNQEQQAIQSIKRVSDLYVNLRCMQVFDKHIEIYVGGGITKDSRPEAEYLETLAKSQTLLNVL